MYRVAVISSPVPLSRDKLLERENRQFLLERFLLKYSGPSFTVEPSAPGADWEKRHNQEVQKTRTAIMGWLGRKARSIRADLLEKTVTQVEVDLTGEAIKQMPVSQMI